MQAAGETGFAELHPPFHREALAQLQRLAFQQRTHIKINRFTAQLHLLKGEVLKHHAPGANGGPGQVALQQAPERALQLQIEMLQLAANAFEPELDGLADHPQRRPAHRAIQVLATSSG